MKKKSRLKILVTMIFIAMITCIMAHTVSANAFPLPTVELSIGEAQTTEQVSRSMQLLLVVTLITLSPILLVMLTSFTRLIIAFHFVRAALGTQQMPPNQILVGLALILTLFIMGPTFTQVNENAVKPYAAGEMTQEQAIEEGMKPIRAFMFRQVNLKDVEMFSGLAQLSPYPDYETMYNELPNSVLIPSFIVGELTYGFKIGFILYIPFICIDMVVASILMAMGMMMLPPAMISLPFKMLFFVMINGWSLIMENLVLTFNLTG